jgi:hypothetical protein
MKKLFTIACTLVLGGALSFAQAGTTQNPPASGDQTKTGTSTDTGKSGKKHKGHHKGGKKSKKNSGGSTTPPPK